jgi:hypothetical protein
MAIPNPPNPWLAARLKPIILPVANQLGDMPDGYIKVMTRFNGEKGLSVEDHLTAFQHCTNNFLVDADDVFSRMLTHSLEGGLGNGLESFLTTPLGIGDSSKKVSEEMRCQERQQILPNKVSYP